METNSDTSAAQGGAGEAAAQGATTAATTAGQQQPEQQQPPTQQQQQPASSGDRPATLAELREVCGADASSDFLLAQLDAGATASQALRAYTAQLKADLAAARQSARHEQAAGRAPEQVRQLQASGVAGTAASDSSADPVAAFERVVEERAAAGQSRRDAVMSAVADFPEQYAAYREAVRSMGAHDVDRRRRRRVNRDLVAV